MPRQRKLNRRSPRPSIIGRIRKWGIAEWASIATIIGLPLTALGLYTSAEANRTTPQPQQVSVKASDEAPGSSLVAVSVESDPDRFHFGVDPPYMSYIVPQPIDAIERGLPSAGRASSQCAGSRRWWKSQGGIDAVTHFQLVLRGLTDNVLLTAKAKILKKASPMRGIAALCYSQGEVEVRDVIVDLDRPNQIYYIKGAPSGNPVKKPFLFTLQKNEVEVMDVVGIPRSSFYEWELTITASAQGRSYEVKVNDRGQPFRTSSARNVTGFYDVTFSNMPPDKRSLDEATATDGCRRLLPPIQGACV
jgi:hypothetical protein